jgi:REP element-mobilizing transposase RayT
MAEPKLEYGKFYHIYNRGINACELFRENSNYEHFLRLYDKYIPLIADTFAWVLMRNHFHLLVKIKKENEIFNKNNLLGLSKPDRFRIDNRPAKQFSNLFNAYTKAFNKKYKRTGSLFERPFHRTEIGTRNYLLYLIYYIHHNPVHHGFVDEMIEYPWSSYLTICSPKRTKLKRKEVLKWFNNFKNFENFHNEQHNINQIETYIFQT